jgi:hypothetical protein
VSEEERREASLDRWLSRDHEKESGREFVEKANSVKRQAIIDAGYTEPLTDDEVKRISVTATGKVTWLPEGYFDETHPDYSPTYGVVMPWGPPGTTEYEEWIRERAHLGRGNFPR